MRRRLTLLVSVISIALFGAACGRATEDQINQALGITPTATMSAADIASATAAVTSTHEARLLAASSPSAASVGDVTAGKRQFDTWCIGCHGPGGSGPDILSSGSPGSSVTLDSMTTLIREGTGHTPGAYRDTELSDKQIADLTAYLQSAPGG